jgi:hypothetical protein
VQCCGIEVRSIWPNQCVDFRVDSNLIEYFDIAQRPEKLSMKNRPKIDRLSGPVLELYPERVGTNDFEGPDFMNSVWHIVIATVQLEWACVPLAIEPSHLLTHSDAIPPKLQPGVAASWAWNPRSIQQGRD